MKINYVILTAMLMTILSPSSMAGHSVAAGTKIIDSSGLYVRTTASKNMESGSVRVSKAFGVFNGYDAPQDKRFGDVFLSIKYDQKAAPEWKIQDGKMTVNYPNGDVVIVVIPKTTLVPHHNKR